jgi:hypothetical protein
MWLFTRSNNEPDAASMASQGAFVAPKVSKAAPAKTAKEVMDTPTLLAWADVGNPVVITQGHEVVARLSGDLGYINKATRDAGAAIRVSEGTAM